MSTHTLFLPRFICSNIALMPLYTGYLARIGSLPTDSIRITSAPRSARIWLQNGPAIMEDISTIRMPAQGPTIEEDLDRVILKSVNGSGSHRYVRGLVPIMPGRLGNSPIRVRRCCEIGRAHV